MSASERGARAPGLALALVLAACVALAAGCGERPRSNPLDPQNPETGGGPQAFRALAGASTIGLRWQAAPAGANLLGYSLSRRRVGNDLFDGPAIILDLASTSYEDESVVDDADYEYLLAFVDRDTVQSGTGVLAQARPGPEVVWVADPGADELVRLTPDGRARVLTVTGAKRVNRMSIDVGDGAVWATEPFDARVRIFTALGGPLATWPFANSPNALAVHAGTGTAWIADEALGGVVRVDRAGTMLADAGAFTNPQDVAVTADGGAWVVDAAVGTVTRIAANGARGAVAALGGDPRRAAVDALDGSVWVTRFAADEVIKLSADGEILARTALGPGPFAIDIDEARNLVWVGLDTGNAIVALDRRVGGEVRRVDSVPRPRGLVVADRTGEVWVAAIATGEVVRVSSAGVVLGRTGGFAAPFDVRLDPGPRSLPPAPARTGSRW
jgi:hypothetical protein